MSVLDQARAWARRIKRDSVTLWFACRDRRTPWAVKGLCVLVVAYALSPIDLIPDFIPVLGHVDDALLVAWALRYVTRLAGREVVEELWPGSERGLRVVLAR